MALDATIFGTGSNSYITQAVANDYFADRLGSDDWTNATSATRDAALITATTRLEQEDYQGSRVYYSQRLQWPRYMVYDRDDVVYDHTLMPLPLQQAQSELALALIRQPTMFDTPSTAGYRSMTIGDVSVEGRATSASVLPDYVKTLLAPLLLGRGQTIVQRA